MKRSTFGSITVLAGIALLFSGFCRASSSSDNAEVEIPPRAIHQVSPKYPADLVAQKVDGIVIIDIVINREGLPISLDPILATDRRFVNPAKIAAFYSHFAPGTIGGRPVTSHMQLPFVFELSGHKKLGAWVEPLGNFYASIVKQWFDAATESNRHPPSSPAWAMSKQMVWYRIFRDPAGTLIASVNGAEGSEPQHESQHFLDAILPSHELSPGLASYLATRHDVFIALRVWPSLAR